MTKWSVFLAAAILSAATIAVAQPVEPGGAGASKQQPEAGPPSEVIFPLQRIALRFDHALHTGVGVACKTCHPGALSSTKSADRLLPAPTTCDACHGSDHANLDAVGAGDGSSGACATCHDGYRAGDGNKVTRTEIPPPNLTFDHARHAARNIGCPKCHGAVEKVALATREQLPRMKGCFGCHGAADAASRGEAASACETCHLTWSSSELRHLPPNGSVPRLADRGGRIRTHFASGVLLPPRWLKGAEHTPDFLERHKRVAGADSAFCANCHGEDFCTACHDGRVRPRSVHPGDYLSMHAVEARMATAQPGKCTSCHQQQSFCVGCHMRSGVSMSGPPNARSAGRFHPPKEIWSDAPRRPGHHGVEAQRNLNACVSCHIERDCVTCHGAGGVGGGFTPHRPGFAAGCGAELRRNPRPCFTCHLPDDPILAGCR